MGRKILNKKVLENRFPKGGYSISEVNFEIFKKTKRNNIWNPTFLIK